MAMQLKKNGAVLMRDTASVMNAAIENIGVKGGLKPGLTFAELMWSDRHLWVITRVVSEKTLGKVRDLVKYDCREQRWDVQTGAYAQALEELSRTPPREPVRAGTF